MSAPRAILLVLALAACKRAPDAAPAAPPAAAPASPSASASSGASPLVDAPPGTLFPSGVMLSGGRASMQHYLRYVDTVIGAKVKLKYAPAAVVLDRDAAIRAVRSASWDGVTWHFDPSEPAVQKIKPGSVLLIWGLAIRKVTQVDRAGDEIVVTSSEAQLTDLVTDAAISWNAPAHLRQGVMTMLTPKPVDSVTFRRASYDVSPAPATFFRFASFADDSEPADTSPPAQYQQSFKLEIAKYQVAIAYGAPSEDQLNFYAQFAYGEDAEEPAGLPNELGDVTDKAKEFAKWAKEKQDERDKEAKEGKKKGKEVRQGGKTMSGPGPGLRQATAPTSEEQHKQKAEEEEEAEYEKKYGKQSRNSTEGMPKLPKMPAVPTSFGGAAGSAWKELVGRTAIKVTGVGTITGLSSEGDIQIEGGRLQHAMLSNPAFHLQGDVLWAARIDKAVFAGHTHVEVPVAFRMPLIIGGLPFFLEIGINAQIQPAITSKMATAKGQRHIDFTKSAQLTFSPGSVSSEASEPDVKAEKGPEEKLTGLGVSGLMIALQVPRVAFGFGILGTNAKAYFDVVVASGATYTGTTGIIQCTKEIMNVSFNYGYGLEFLGLPVAGDRKTGAEKKFEWMDPPGAELSRVMRHRLAGALFLALAASAHAQTIPARPGMVLSYSHLQTDRNYDKQFLVTVVSVDTNETIFQAYFLDQLATAKHFYPDTVSRREWLGARGIGVGAGTNDFERIRNRTIMALSKKVYQQLKQNGRVDDVATYIIMGESEITYRVQGSQALVGTETLTVVIDGLPRTVTALHTHGKFERLVEPIMQVDADNWYLDDPDFAWVIKIEQVIDAKPYHVRLGTVSTSPADAGKALDAALANGCKAEMYGIYFAYNSAVVTSVSDPTLAQVAAVLKSHTDWTLTIQGHTDSIGGAKYNQELSAKRAAAVKEKLVSKYGVAASRLQSDGVGLARPLAPNTTLEGRARNRRVELVRPCAGK